MTGLYHFYNLPAVIKVAVLSFESFHLFRPLLGKSRLQKNAGHPIYK